MDTSFAETLAEFRIKANATRLQNQTRRRQYIIELSRGFPISNAIIQSHFGVSRQTASGDLAILVQQGALTRVGKGRRTAYTCRE